MTQLVFSVDDVRADESSLSPTIRIRVRIAADGEVDAIALRVRIQIEPWRRHYANGERELLRDLSLRKPVQFADAAVMVAAFSGATVVDVPIACTYDAGVAATKYICALEGGDVPLRCFFNGTLFNGGLGSYAVEMLPWNLECEAVLPVAVWERAMNACFPGQAWLRVDRATFDALLRYRAHHAFTDWDRTLAHLLASAFERDAV